MDPFQFTDQARMAKKRQSDFRKILGNKYIVDTLSVLSNPENYYNDNEDIDSVHMEVLRDMQK